MAMQILFPDASQRLPYAMKTSGKQFSCPCNGGTRFVVFTTANVPQASCPVCGSVCDPFVESLTFLPFKAGPP